MTASVAIRWLASTTSEAWLQQALAHPHELLVDHAHCERKAAGAALQLLFRYPSAEDLALVLAPLIREEMEHFERVVTLLQRRGVALRPLPAPPYGARLAAEVRRQEPQRQLDSFLVAGLIEARSHERLGLLARRCADPELRQLWAELLASEARHFGVYWLLAEARWPRAQLSERLEQLAAVEAAVLADLWPQPRMHS
jgi:tRNA-(ms[2]io[6]A)-hydroxylase